MPVVFIKGPSGLSKNSKKELIEATLRTLVETCQMPDDRVYIEEVSEENVGHTPLFEVTSGDSWAVQSEPRGSTSRSARRRASQSRRSAS